jgi:hypothetical protein
MFFYICVFYETGGDYHLLIELYWKTESNYRTKTRKKNTTIQRTEAIALNQGCIFPAPMNHQG